MGAGGRARLFVALELPDGVREPVSEWARALTRLEPGLRPVGADGLHVTLCFLGSLPLEAAREVGAVCDALPDGPIHGLALGPAVWLPRRHPRVLAVTLMDPAGRLGALQARLARSLVSRGLFESEGRRFLPHVTAARVRRGTRGGGSLSTGPPEGEFTGERVTLFRSHLGEGPARYEALHRTTLSAE